MNVYHASTTDRVQLFQQVQPTSKHAPTMLQPKRALPYRSLDDLIMYVDDEIGPDSQHLYKVKNWLGSGTFGQVVECVDMTTSRRVAIKIAKPKYDFVAHDEAAMLESISKTLDPDCTRMVRYHGRFHYKGRVCLVFECLSITLLEAAHSYRVKHDKHLPITIIQSVTKDILQCMSALRKLNVMHCDIKPENILCEQPNEWRVKVADFGIACYMDRRKHDYIQSRPYRAPEVILGNKTITPAIDVWSLGCLVFELFMGAQLFVQPNSHRTLRLMIDLLGPPPQHLISSDALKSYFQPEEVADESKQLILKSDLLYWMDKLTKAETTMSIHKRVKELPSCRPVVLKNNFENSVLQRKTSTSQEACLEVCSDVELEARMALVSFLHCMLQWDANDRWTPDELLQHPFIVC